MWQCIRLVFFYGVIFDIGCFLHTLDHVGGCFSTPHRKVILVQPLSAAAETVFSILTNTVDHLQISSLVDYISTSVMLQQ